MTGIKEIAEEFGISRETVRKILTRYGKPPFRDETLRALKEAIELHEKEVDGIKRTTLNLVRRTFGLEGITWNKLNTMQKSQRTKIISIAGKILKKAGIDPLSIKEFQLIPADGYLIIRFR